MLAFPPDLVSSPPKQVSRRSRTLNISEDAAAVSIFSIFSSYQTAWSPSYRLCVSLPTSASGSKACQGIICRFCTDFKGFANLITVRPRNRLSWMAVLWRQTRPRRNRCQCCLPTDNHDTHLNQQLATFDGVFGTKRMPTIRGLREAWACTRPHDLDKASAQIRTISGLSPSNEPLHNMMSNHKRRIFGLEACKPPMANMRGTSSHSHPWLLGDHQVVLASRARFRSVSPLSHRYLFHHHLRADIMGLPVSAGNWAKEQFSPIARTTFADWLTLGKSKKELGERNESPLRRDCWSSHPRIFLVKPADETEL